MRHARPAAWLIWLLLLAAPVAVSANTFEGNADDIDGDGVPNARDRDSDNDGILDRIECPDPAAACPDFDNDGVPDHLDIDSDGDGITDAHEAFGNDADGDGCYDGFDDRNRDGVDDGIAEAGTPPIDSDADQNPDHLDDDSDGDGIPDSVEGHDVDGDGLPDTMATGIDVDQDGLDDGFDAYCSRVDLCENTMLGGKPAPTPDLDGNGVEDFREPESMQNSDAGPDAGPDMGTDAGPDMGTDAGTDAGMDAGTDADTGTNIESDASGFDASDADDPLANDLYVDGGGCSSVPVDDSTPAWFALLLAITVLRRRRR